MMFVVDGYSRTINVAYQPQIGTYGNWYAKSKEDGLSRLLYLFLTSIINPATHSTSLCHIVLGSDPSEWATPPSPS